MIPLRSLVEHIDIFNKYGVSVKQHRAVNIIMWNIGMAQKAKETRSGCLVHIVQLSDIRHM